ncbi:xanthotoxin 5-hydroxylase CYP82C2-like [Nymphaea colorata]|uniref:xanthotoxin 5-hydroxylase CYP82C2-like n=1 Tax=Nymphaea colorata TaxID=210225 RepID=UPI00129ED23F|nr:xanthotoxin 5-hydroxylase CYP82C2-like [Nymphaea colorata]
MALLIPSPETLTTPVLTGACFLFMFLFMFQSMFMKRKGAAPQPPMPTGWLPVIGHLHLLSSKPQVLKATFSRWHEEYDPVLMLQLGLLVSSWEMAKECFTTNDLAFSNRPLSAAAKYLESSMMTAAKDSTTAAMIRTMYLLLLHPNAKRDS